MTGLATDIIQQRSHKTSINFGSAPSSATLRGESQKLKKKKKKVSDKLQQISRVFGESNGCASPSCGLSMLLQQVSKSH